MNVPKDFTVQESNVYFGALVILGVTVNSNHRVIILNRGSMFAFQGREFSSPLSSAHSLFP